MPFVASNLKHEREAKPANQKPNHRAYVDLTAVSRKVSKTSDADRFTV